MEVAEEIYRLDERAEGSLAALDAVLCALAEEASGEAAYRELLAARLPEGMTLEGATVRWQETDGGTKTLVCAAEIAPLGSFPRCRMIEHRLQSGMEDEAEGAEIVDGID